MADKTIPSFVGMAPSGDSELGRVQLAPEVLEVIIGIATTEVKGVANTRGNFATGVAEKFGKVNMVKVSKQAGLKKASRLMFIALSNMAFLFVHVALEIQKQIRHAIFHMTSLETKEVNVHITGIEFEAGTETV